MDEARTRAGGGAGLGLANARDTSPRHGGTIAVADSPTGDSPTGARFVVNLPAAPDVDDGRADGGGADNVPGGQPAAAETTRP